MSCAKFIRIILLGLALGITSVQGCTVEPEVSRAPAATVTPLPAGQPIPDPTETPVASTASPAPTSTLTPAGTSRVEPTWTHVPEPTESPLPLPTVSRGEETTEEMTKVGAEETLEMVVPRVDLYFQRSFELDDLSAVDIARVITVTVDFSNGENVPLRGFYFSDQAPNGWEATTWAVWVDGRAVSDYLYEQGVQDEVYLGFTPHRWMLEIPQGGGNFSPPHPIPAAGGTARIVYTMKESSGAGGSYYAGHEVWAGWLETQPTGTAVFGYQTSRSDHSD